MSTLVFERRMDSLVWKSESASQQLIAYSDSSLERDDV